MPPICQKMRARAAFRGPMRSGMPRRRQLSLSAADRDALLAVCAGSSDSDALGAHNVDWTRQFRGNAPLVLYPRSTGDVSAVMRLCQERRISVVPQGGNTGLVGGSLAYNGEVVLALRHMNSVIDVDAAGGMVTAEAGIVLEALDEALEKEGLTVPVDLGAKGSCQLGGVCSTNAGGLRFCRFGSLLGNVVGLEVVLPGGDVLDLLSRCRKDNTGVPLRQLFLGAEGTLGVITKVCLAAPPKPTSVQVCMIGVDGMEDARRTLLMAKERLPDILSAFEILDAEVLRSVLRYQGRAEGPLGPAEHPFYVLVETYGSSEARDAEALGEFFEALAERGAAESGVLAQDRRQASDLWQLRELCPVATAADGYVLKYDLSLPLGKWDALCAAVREKLRAHEGSRLHVWGHAADGNIHLNVVSPAQDEALRGALEPWVYEWTASNGGSFSAEHGVGVLKRGAMSTKPPGVLAAMRGIKQLFDPHGICNPGKILPP